MTDFLMPSLGADMEAGTLVEWHVKPGDPVRKGDIVAVVETQKGAIEIEIFEEGTVGEILAAVGQEVPVGAVLARIERPGATAPAVPVPPLPTAKAAATPPPTTPLRVAEPPPQRVAGDAIKISPVARRRAQELGLDPRHLRGTGVDGAICLADIEAAAGSPRVPPSAPKRRTGFDPVEMRKAIAAAMSRSKREIPHYYLTESVDMAAALARLDELNAVRPPTTRLLSAVLLLRAVAIALARVPGLNGFWEKDGFRPGAGCHIGWAIALRGGGLVAPAIPDADRCSLDELMTRMRDLVQRARSGGLRSSELTLPTVTVTSLGERGAESVLPVIYPPQVAMVGFGRIALRPRVVDGALAIRPTTIVTLAADHRASDGHRGGQLLAEIANVLQEPEEL